MIYKCVECMECMVCMVCMVIYIYMYVERHIMGSYWEYTFWSSNMDSWKKTSIGGGLKLGSSNLIFWVCSVAMFDL